MTAQEGRGVQTLSQLVKQLSRLNPIEAASIIDLFDDAEISDVLAAVSAARVAQEGEVARDAFDESVARRLTSLSGPGVPS
jgi:hypothetical protein